MLSKKIIISFLFFALMLVLFLIFGPYPIDKRQTLEALQTNGEAQ